MSRIATDVPRGRARRRRIDVVVYDGFDELDALGPLEVFRRAARRGAELQARLVTPTRQKIVRGAHGVGVLADGIAEPGRADVLVVAGGGWVARADVGAWGEARRGHLPALLRRAALVADVVAGVCTGVMLLALAGAIGTRPATTHHGARRDLAAAGATVVTDRIVDDGDLVTCAGVTSGIDLALWLVEREFSRELADQVAEDMEYSRTRPAGNGGRTAAFG
jgi:transcriptional regulator GlxA family with amidase domain